MAKFDAIVFTAVPEASASPQGAMTKVDGRESLLRAVELFVNREGVVQITVGLVPDQAEAIKTKLGSHLMILGVKTASGGPALLDQLKAARARLSTDSTHVVLHDAARPCVAQPELDALLEASANADAIAMSCGVSGTMVSLDETDRIIETIGTRSLRSLLTPQVFSRQVFDELCDKGFESIRSRLELHDSSKLNIRVNSASDATLARTYLTLLPKPKVKASSNPFEEASW
jgi:2-C-methyl-D-erythritol 4-phosphate cytidylyltransferase